MKIMLFPLIAGLFAIGCGGRDATLAMGNGSCKAVAPCGGSVVGTWQLQSACMFSDAADASPSYGCVGSALTIAASGISYTFDADGPFTVKATGTVNETIRYAGSCFHSDAGAGSNCTDLQQSMRKVAQSTGDGAGSPYESFEINCSLDSSDCLCNSQFVYANVTSSGMYSISGTQITTTQLASSLGTTSSSQGSTIEQPADYCVLGNTLTLVSKSPSGHHTVTVLTR